MCRRCRKHIAYQRPRKLTQGYDVTKHVIFINHIDLQLKNCRLTLWLTDGLLNETETSTKIIQWRHDSDESEAQEEMSALGGREEEEEEADDEKACTGSLSHEGSRESTSRIGP